MNGVEMNGMMINGTNGFLRYLVYGGTAVAGVCSSIFLAGRNLVLKQDLRETENRIKADIREELQQVEKRIKEDISGLKRS